MCSNTCQIFPERPDNTQISQVFSRSLQSSLAKQTACITITDVLDASTRAGKKRTSRPFTQKVSTREVTPTGPAYRTMRLPHPCPKGWPRQYPAGKPPASHPSWKTREFPAPASDHPRRLTTARPPPAVTSLSKEHPEPPYYSVSQKQPLILHSPAPPGPPARPSTPDSLLRKQ